MLSWLRSTYDSGQRRLTGNELPMPQSPIVRPATRADIGVLAAFNSAMAWETERKRLDPERLTRGIEGPFAQPGRGRYFVAEIDGAVVGCLLVTYEWSDWRNGDWWWIQSVYVVEAARRLGVFRALYAEVERQARATAGVVGLRLYVERDNARAQATYVALGMEECQYHMYERGFVTLEQG